MSSEHEHAEGMREQEQRIREKADEGSASEAVAEEIEREMREKSPGEAIKDDMKAVKEDLQESLSGDGSEDDEAAPERGAGVDERAQAAGAIRCPGGDDGECRVPDPTVVISNGTPSMVSLAEARQMISTPVQELGPVVEIPHGAVQELEEFAAADDSHPAERPDRVPSEVFTLDEGVMVTCSPCGHVWIYGSDDERSMSPPS